MRASILVLFAGVILTSRSGAAQTVDSIQSVRRELDELRQTQAATLREVREIRRLLAARNESGSMSTPDTIDGRGPSLGRSTAPITIVEFSDYQCPYCGQFFRETLPLLIAEYVKTGRVRFVYHDFPISSLHPGAMRAAEAARCAGDQDRYWDYHNALFKNQADIGERALVNRALTLSLDTVAFNRCLGSGRHSEEIRQSIAQGARAGVDGTPLFFIGKVDPGTTSLRIARVIQGAKAYPEFKEAIDDLLSTAGARQTLK
jgi:protein-disulfide isomerase